MQPNKFSVLFLSLIARICVAGIILKSAEPDTAFDVDKAAINVITSCYENRGNAVAVGGHISRFLVKTLSSQHIPVVLVDNSTSIAVQFRGLQRIFRYNLQVFVVAVSNASDFKKIIREIRMSVWWHHLAYFLILYRSSQEQGCKGVEMLMFQAWQLNMVNAKIICFNRSSGTHIFGYNPYTTEAPELWKLHATVRTSVKNNNFTLFQRPYREGKEICKNVDFEKMKNLNGYPVEELYEFRGELMHTGQQKHIKNDASMYGNIVSTLIRVINGTQVIVIHDITTKNRQKRIPLRDMVVGIGEMTMGQYIPVSRAVLETGKVAMTQHSGHMSQLQKIVSVVDIYSNIGVCIVLIITLVFFKFFIRQALMLAILNIIRIVCNTGFTNLPQNTPPRLYLTSVFLFVVTMQGIYQGNLASLLTTEVPLPNVDTWQDLVNSHYTIYGYDEGDEFQDPMLEGRVIRLKGSGDCVQYVLRDASAACVNFESILKDQAEKLKLHLSETLNPSLGVFQFRRDWPIEAQFNIILGKLFEADVIVPFHLRLNQKTLSDFKLDEDVKNNQIVRTMTLRDIRFAFVILGIGLACASITFIMEIVISRSINNCKKLSLRK